MRMLQAKHGSKRNYVIQQGIRLIEIDGRLSTSDSTCIRTARTGGPWLASVPKAGRARHNAYQERGSLMTPEQALGRAFGSKAREVLERAKDAAIAMSEAIENHHPHLLEKSGSI